jgi:hypothetical protein
MIRESQSEGAHRFLGIPGATLRQVQLCPAVNQGVERHRGFGALGFIPQPLAPSLRRGINPLGNLA